MGVSVEFVIIMLLVAGLVFQAFRLRKEKHNRQFAWDMAHENAQRLSAVVEENNEFYKGYAFCAGYKPTAGELYTMVDHIRNHVYMSQDYKDNCDKLAKLLNELSELDINEDIR